MKFKFYPVESRIYDFLKFPRLIYYRETMDKGEDNLKQLAMENYLSFVKKVEDSLRSFTQDIEKFYMKQFFYDYDFIDLVSRMYTVLGCKDEKDYLNKLLSLNGEEINKSIMYSFLVIDEDRYSDTDEIMNKVEEISRDREILLSYIKEMPIDSGAKWNLFLIVEEPVKYMNMYVELMEDILPIFIETYMSYEGEVQEYGKNLVNFLNKEGSNGLEEITYSIIDGNVIDSEENNILISLVYSYAISINTLFKNKYIAWGLKMEEAFKAMKEINENKTNERVQIFKNLGDKTRYEVLKLIASRETSTKEIANQLGVSSATISYHINNLLTSKIIKMDKIEEKYGYVLDYEFINEAIKDFLEDIKSP